MGQDQIMPVVKFRFVQEKPEKSVSRPRDGVIKIMHVKKYGFKKFQLKVIAKNIN